MRYESLFFFVYNFPCLRIHIFRFFRKLVLLAVIDFWVGYWNERFFSCLTDIAHLVASVPFSSWYWAALSYKIDTQNYRTLYKPWYNILLSTSSGLLRHVFVFERNVNKNKEKKIEYNAVSWKTWEIVFHVSEGFSWKLYDYAFQTSSYGIFNHFMGMEVWWKLHFLEVHMTSSMKLLFHRLSK